MDTNKVRHVTSSYRFKNYNKIVEVTKGSKRKHYVGLVVDGILQLVNDARDAASEVQGFLASEKTQRHICAGKHIPKAILRRVQVVQSKLESAFVCFQQGAKAEVADSEVEDILKQMAHVADEMLQVVDSLSIFARNNIISRVALVQKRLQWIVSNAELARLKLIPYTKTATIATLPTNPNIVVPPPPSPSSRTLFTDTEAAPLTPFFEKAQQRGWRVAEKQIAEPVNSLPLVDDDLEDSFALLTRLQKPTTELLADDVVVGVAQFPVISLSTQRIPDAVIQDCIHPTLGYDFYLVLGSYMVIDKMCLLGIHHKIMKVCDENNRIQLDVDKFIELHPYLVSEQPEWAHVLNQTHPIQPAKREGSHYYCPLVPNVFTHKWGRGIGNWDFLTA